MKNKKNHILLLILKFVISIVWDILDFTLFRIPVLGTITDIISVPIALKLWGNTGYLAVWEIVFDFTDQFDGEIPTLTLIGLLSVIVEKK